MLHCLSILCWLVLFGEFSASNATSSVEKYNAKIIFNNQSYTDIGNNYTPRFELVLNLRNLTLNREDEAIENHYEKRSRNNRRKKEKHSKLYKQKNKTNQTDEFDIGRIHRNDEKDILVRNRTIEILKNGLKILSASGVQTFEGNKALSQVNETLLEKILSSGASKPDLLISGIYKLPIGGNMYEKKDIDEINSSSVENVKPHFSKVKNKSRENAFLFDDGKDKTSQDQTFNYEYDYDEVKESNNRNDIVKSYAFNAGYEAVGADNNVRNVLEQIIRTLRTLGDVKIDGNIGENGSSSFKDPCSKWLECKSHLEKAFIGQNDLPSCPCHYPSTIFYNDAIWDENQKKFFRWRDASNEAERLDIYKPGALYCIRSLLAQSDVSISSQQCCYDGKLRLLTRGSGAGTINFVSPDISKELHDTVDVLPWRLCKGDFTRYNIARQPNNGNRCSTNPSDELYEMQVKLSKFF